MKRLRLCNIRKIMLTFIIFLIFFNIFSFNRVNAASGSLYDYIYASDKNKNYTYWDPQDTYKNEDMTSIDFMQEALQEKHRSLQYYWVNVYYLSKFISGSISYKNLASDNEAKYLTFAYRIIQKGLQNIGTDNISTYFELDDGSLITVTDYLNNGKEALRKLLAAVNFKGTSYMFDEDKAVWKADGKEINVKDSDDIKKKYTEAQKALYIKTFGYYGVNDAVKKAWAYSRIINLDANYDTMLGYDKIRITAFLKLYGVDNNLGLGSFKEYDTILTEWHSVVVNEKHTEWYSSSERFYNSDKKYNKSLTPMERIKKWNEIKKVIDNIDIDVDQLLGVYDDGNDEYFKTLVGKTAEEVYEDNKKNITTLFEHPKQAENADEPMNADQAMSDANGLLEAADQTILSTEDIQSIMNPIYSMTLTIATVIIAVVGSIMGTKFATGTLAQKALIKSMLWPYAIGCAVIYGAFGIWHLAVTVLSGM